MELQTRIARTRLRPMGVSPAGQAIQKAHCAKAAPERMGEPFRPTLPMHSRPLCSLQLARCCQSMEPDSLARNQPHLVQSITGRFRER